MDITEALAVKLIHLLPEHTEINRTQLAAVRIVEPTGGVIMIWSEEMEEEPGTDWWTAVLMYGDEEAWLYAGTDPDAMATTLAERAARNA